MMTAPPDIVREVVIAAPPDEVFPYFTEPDKMIVWKADCRRRRPSGGAQPDARYPAGSVHGYPPTGNSFAVYASDVCRFTDDGMIAEHWGVFDMGSLMQQIGVAPGTHTGDLGLA